MSFSEQSLLVTCVVPRRTGVSGQIAVIGREAWPMTNLSNSFSLSHLDEMSRILTWGVGSWGGRDPLDRASYLTRMVGSHGTQL